MAAAPYNTLEVTGESVTVDLTGKKFVLYSGDVSVLPYVNEHLTSSIRCSLTETPCGGVKNVPIPDYLPGTLSIVGAGCYLKNMAGTYTGKVLSAGKMAEQGEIINTESTGLIYCTADGVEYLTADGYQYLIAPPNVIICEYQVTNVSDTSTNCQVTVRCPDDVTQLQLYNIDTNTYENVTFTQENQNFGSVNSYTFSRLFAARTTVRMQVMITYSSLAYTFKLSNDANLATGIQNLKSWITYYNPSEPEIDFLVFTKLPDSLTISYDNTGNPTQFVFPKPVGTIKSGRTVHSTPSRFTSGDVPDCLYNNIPGSLTRLLRGTGSIPNVSNVTLTTYVVPAISDDKIIPKSIISESLISSTITIRASPGEYTSASFVIKSNTDAVYSVYASDLTSGGNTISKENVDIKYVKSWYQGGNSSFALGLSSKYLTPELLLYDDSFIRVEGEDFEYTTIPNQNGKNYIKFQDGTYQDISTPPTSSTNFQIADTDDRKPVHIPQNFNKQVWVTFHVPTGAVTGSYTGHIDIRIGGTVLKQITINMTVLPITLSTPSIKSSLYTRGKIYASSIISTEQKTLAQYRADVKDMVKHGVLNPTIRVQADLTSLEHVLAIRQEEGMDNTRIYYQGYTIDNTIEDIAAVKALCEEYGATTLYVYGYDEQSLNTSEIRAKIATIHAIGVKVFNAQTKSMAASVADILDLAVVSYDPDPELAATYHSHGHEIYSYANPQSVPEYPRTYRLNYGLLLWQNNYNGAMDFAFQTKFNDVWNDFDYSSFRDHCFTYPTLTGSIDTIQWEGYREASNDLRYLTALTTAISAHPGSVATAANNWLTSIKNSDLSTANLDTIRSQMIDYILQLEA